MNCPNCSAALSERGCFCKTCGSQARCFKCKELLEVVAVACVECGTRVGQGVPSAIPVADRPATAETALPANRNTISYEEDRNSRKFAASFTNDAIGGLGDTLAEFFVQRGMTRPTRPAFQRDGGVTIEHPKELLAPAGNAAEVPTPPQQDHPPPATDLSNISTLFQPNGETLELVDDRLKAKSGTDFLCRLTYLFLYANELHGRSTTPKASVIAVLKEGKIWDSNAGFWLRKKKGFKVDAEDRFQLIGGGRDAAKKYLTEALDSNIPNEWTPDTKVVTKRAPRKKKA